MSTYDSQDDFERCRPNITKGTDFRRYNEYVVEVLNGLRANGVPAEPVVVHYAEFEKFLNGGGKKKETHNKQRTAEISGGQADNT
jgi:hypothetical protein